MNFKLLRQKDFLLLMLGKLVSLIGSEMQTFALSLYVLKITGSATIFASVLSITIIPRLVLGPIAGVFIDWIDRKKIIVFLDMLSGIIIGIHAVIFMINGGLSLPNIYVLVLALSFISLVFQPAISTIMPSIIKKENLIDGNGINSLVMNLGGLLAPILAGVLFGLYGLHAILIINSMSFILSAISEMFIKVPKVNKKTEKITAKTFIKDFSEGLNFMKNKKIILTITSLGCIANFAFAPISSIGLAFISKEILKVSDYQYGILESVLVISMIIGPFIIGKISKRFSVGKIFFLDIFINGVLVAIMAIIPSSLYLNLFSSNKVPYLSLMAIIFMIGLVLSVGSIATGTLFQQEVPIEIMGRANTVMSSISMAIMPIGQMLFGFLFDNIPAWMCLAITSIIYLVSSLVFRKSLCGNESSSNEDTSIQDNCSIENNPPLNGELGCDVVNEN